VVAGVPLAAMLLAGAALGQEHHCADCHFAQALEPPASIHLSEWQSSAHGRADVPCSGCHGGDPTTFEPLRAHAGVLSSGNPGSPTHWRNLPRTCGGCHPGAWEAFQSSRHLGLLDSGERGPTCATCHGSVAAHLLSSKGLERACRSCHREGREAGHADYPALARDLHERIVEVRELLRPALRMVRAEPEEARRLDLERRYRAAEAPLREVVERAHSFELDGFEERLSAAAGRARELLGELARGPGDR
jgi:hypothetical protein